MSPIRKTKQFDWLGLQSTFSTAVRLCHT